VSWTGFEGSRGKLAVARFLAGDVTSDVLQLVAKELVLPVLLGQKKPPDAAHDAQ
jgi:hypothetical protein